MSSAAVYWQGGRLPADRRGRPEHRSVFLTSPRYSPRPQWGRGSGEGARISPTDVLADRDAPEGGRDGTDIDLEALAYTLQVGREAMKYRAVFLCAISPSCISV